MPEVIDRQTIKALGIETRQDIMKMLANRPYTASEIAKIRKKHVTTIAEHLTVLEKSGLVRKKDSTNKWVYYELTERGEHLFKPQFYSWVVVLSLSIVFMFVGLLRLAGLNGTQEASQAVPGAMPMMAARSTEIAGNIQAAPAFDVVGLVLIVLGIAGFAYLAYRKYHGNSTLQRAVR